MWPHRWQPIRLLHPWDSPGKNTRVGCHFLLQCVKVKVKSLSRVQLVATPWTVAYQAPLSLGYRQALRAGVSRELWFSSVTQSCPTLCNPMDCTMSGLPVHHQLPELAQTHVQEVGDAIHQSHSLLSPSPPAFNLFQHQGLFQWVSSLHQVAKVLEFQLQLSLGIALSWVATLIPHSWVSFLYLPHIIIVFSPIWF